MTGRTDTASRLVAAPPDAVYAAFVNPARLLRWLPPEGMSGRVLEFDPREGGRWRIELSYDEGGTGKTSAHRDVSHGRFLALEPGRRIVQAVRFEGDDPAFAGEMVMSWTLAPEGDETCVTVTATDVPAGITAEDHEAGLSASLDNLARLLAPAKR